MRLRYRIRVCPEDGCPAISSKAGTRCPTHGKEFVAIIVRREEDDVPVSDFKLRQVRDALPKDLQAFFDRLVGKP